MTPLMTALSSAPALLATGLALDPGKIAPHGLFADDGERVEQAPPVVLAAVGNVCGPGSDAIVADIRAAAAGERGPDTLALLGGFTCGKGDGGWKAFEARFGPLLVPPGPRPPPVVPQPEGEVDEAGEPVAPPPPPPRPSGLRAIPVAGPSESAGDSLYTGLGAAFPGVGQEIGYNRVATWYAFDLAVGDADWRVVVLDSNQAALGSRWSEQSRWLEGVLDGEFDSMIALFYDSPYDLAGLKPSASPSGTGGELLTQILDRLEAGKLRLVLTAGSATSQATLPEGVYGPLQIVAGGGGSPAEDLSRWAAGAEGTEPLRLDAVMDDAIMRAFDRADDRDPLSEKARDAVKSTGSFEGSPGVYPAKVVPTWGWWMVSIDGPAVSVTWRELLPEGNVESSWQAFDLGTGGWRVVKP